MNSGGGGMFSYSYAGYAVAFGSEYIQLRVGGRGHLLLNQVK